MDIFREEEEGEKADKETGITHKEEYLYTIIVTKVSQQQCKKTNKLFNFYEYTRMFSLLYSHLTL